MTQENEIQLLSNVHKLLTINPDANQREMAASVDMSLGMTNALLKRFAEKGWVCMNRLSAKNIRYALTPEGMNQIAKRSYRFIKQTMRSMYDYKDIITNFILNAKQQGYSTIILVGSSNIQFIFEYVCNTLSINFLSINENQLLDNQKKDLHTLVIFSEDISFSKENDNQIGLLELLSN